MEIMMPKELNVIRWLIILTVHIGYSQEELSGKFSTLMALQEHYEFYEFKNGAFYFENGGDLGISSYGEGHYHLRGDSLILNYDLTDLEDESYFKSKKYYNANDSIEVRLKIKSFDKKPLENVVVYTIPYEISTKPDRDGTAFLKLKKKTFKDKIKVYIDAPFWAQCIIDLSSDTSYNIEVFMNKSKAQGFGHPKAIKNEVQRFKILEYTDKALVLLDESGTKIIWEKRE